jgi:hypothetical protein
MLITNISALRYAARNRYSSGYPTYWVCDDGEALCHACFVKERRQIIDAVAHKRNDGFRVVALDINYEDPRCFCAHCNARIESAYAEDEA